MPLKIFSAPGILEIADSPFRKSKAKTLPTPEAFSQGLVLTDASGAKVVNINTLFITTGVPTPFSPFMVLTLSGKITINSPWLLIELPP